LREFEPKFAPFWSKKMKKILLAVSGSIAFYKAYELISLFKKEGFKDTRIIYDLSGMMRDVFGRI